MPKITLSVRIEPELKAKLEYTTKSAGLSVADSAKIALFKYIEAWENENGKIPAAFIQHRTEELTEKGRK